MPTLKIIFTSSLGIKKLNYSPKNSSDLKFMLARDKTYKGMGRKITDTFEFVKDGREYLKKLFYAEGIDADLQVEIFLGNSSGWNSSEWLGSYKGDFKEFKINDTTASIKLLDSDFESKLNSRQGTELNLNSLTSIDGNILTGDLLPVKDMSLHDRTILLKNKHVAASQTVYSVSGNPTIDTELFMPLSLDSVYSSNTDVSSTFSSIFSGDNDYPADGIFLMNSEKDINLSVSANLRIGYLYPTFPTSMVSSFRIMSLNKDTYTYKDILYEEIFIKVDGVNPNSVDIVVNDSYQILQGESLVFEFKVNGIGQMNFVILSADNYILTENIDYYKATNPKVILPHESGERLLQMITGEQTPLYAPIFGRPDIDNSKYPTTGEWAYLGLFNGYMVRGFDYNEHPVNTSFKKWFEAYSCILNLAAYIDKQMGYTQLVIDKLENILDSSKVGITIDNYNDLSVTPMAEDYFGVLSFGAEEITHEDFNGLDSFNGVVEHATPLRNIDSKLNKVSTYITDDYAIALTQREPISESATKDTRYDEKNMLIDGAITTSGVIYSRKNEGFTKVEGILAPTQAYNLRISPVRNLMRHARYLMVGLYRKRDKNLKFIKGARNSKLVTRLTTETADVVENADIAINSLGTPFLLPYFITFKSKITLEQFKYVNLHPNELVEMTIDRVKIYGFIDELEANVMSGDDKVEAQFKLMQSNR